MEAEKIDTTPQRAIKKRKARQGSKYDSPNASSPAGSANPSFNVQSPTPNKGRAKSSPTAVDEQKPQQVFGVTQQQQAGDTNTFLRQQILDTAFIIYQQPLHTPLIKLVSLSGIYIQSVNTKSPPNSGYSNQDDPIDLTGEARPIPVFRSGSGSFYPQNTSLNDNTPSSTEVPFYRLALYVDGDCRIESCVSFPQVGENEMIVLGRCLQDLHAKVSRQLWIRQGVLKAVRNGFQGMSEGNGGIRDGSGGAGPVGGESMNGGNVGRGPVGGDIGSYGSIITGQSGMQWILRDEQEGEVLRW